MIEPNIFRNRIIERNGRLGEHVGLILSAALSAVDPYQCVTNALRIDSENLYIGDCRYSWKDYDRVYLIGFGKASVPMARAVMDQLGEALYSACVITKSADFLVWEGYQQKLKILLGGHPVPNQDSILSTQLMLRDLSALTARDLVLVVVSGGGSALFTAPLDGIALRDMQYLTDTVLMKGADIGALNIIRKQLDGVKGGRLAERLFPARGHALILSDVVGDHLDLIASGPTVPDTATPRDAWQLIQQLQLEDDLPESITSVLRGAIASEPTKTSSVKNANRVKHTLVGSNFRAADAARAQAAALGYDALIISDHITGSTSEVAVFLDGIMKTELRNGHPASKPYCLLFGGETTVNVTGDGAGGRNQDLVLRMTSNLNGASNLVFVSFATDGEDGRSPAAGAITDGLLFQEAKNRLGLDIEKELQDCNSYHFFEKAGGVLMTGSTGTNVNDLMMLLGG